MAKDPAFLFYPGDYLRDTQCLSEKSQVAYDRIMCEHMRNICITQPQLNFFIKRLTEDEKSEVMQLLKKIPGGFQIDWVAESICKRREYSKSRAENRKGKSKNISSTYDSHMENEIEIKDENINTGVKAKKNDLVLPWPTAAFAEAWKRWKNYKLEEKRFKYKTVDSEQAALLMLAKISEGHEQVAAEIINQSIANGWTGLFKLKNQQSNGKITTENLRSGNNGKATSTISGIISATDF